MTAAPPTVPVTAGTAAELARVLGAPRPALAGVAMNPTERFRAIGVIASASGQGAALISVDKQPARPFLVGSSVAPGFVLKEVAQREVRLADSLQGAVTASLPLPDPAKVNTEALGNKAPALSSAQSGSLPPLTTLPNTAEAGAGPPPLATIRGMPNAP